MIHPSDTEHINTSMLFFLTPSTHQLPSNFAFISNINFSSQYDIVMILRLPQNV